MRPGGDDRYVIREVLTYRDVLPPPDLDPRSILDLGANIGVSTALLANTYPSATVVAVEPDPENAELCGENTAPWRCELVRAAVWTRSGSVRLGGDSPAILRVEDTGREVDAVSLNDLVTKYGPIDFVKLDVEGAERELLKHETAWASAVGCLSVEVHEPYSVEECSRDLEKLGYSVSLVRAPRVPRVLGRRS